MHNKSTINKRFLKVFEELERLGSISTRAEAARHLDIQPQRMNEILKGRLNVSTAVLSRLFVKYGVDPDYIFLGELPMFRTSKPGKTYDSNIPTTEAAERESSYKRKKANSEIQVRRRNEKNEEVIEYISIKELAKELGLADIERKLDELIAKNRKRKR